MEEIFVSFPKGKAVDARWGPHLVHTDQPIDAGGGGTAPSPYELFLASIATCIGYYALAFCNARGLPTQGLSLLQRTEVDPETKLPRGIRVELTLPSGFPEKYRSAILRAAQGCKVKKTIAHAPSVEVSLVDLCSRPSDPHEVALRPEGAIRG